MKLPSIALLHLWKSAYIHTYIPALLVTISRAAVYSIAGKVVPEVTTVPHALTSPPIKIGSTWTSLVTHTLTCVWILPVSSCAPFWWAHAPACFGVQDLWPFTDNVLRATALTAGGVQLKWTPTSDIGAHAVTLPTVKYTRLETAEYLAIWFALTIQFVCDTNLSGTYWQPDFLTKADEKSENESPDFSSDGF